MTQIRGQPELQRDTLTHKTKAKTNKQKHSAEDGVLAQDAQGLGSSPSTEKKTPVKQFLNAGDSKTSGANFLQSSP